MKLREFTAASLGFPAMQPTAPINTAQVEKTTLREPSRWNQEEQNILQLLADGHSRETVASTLGISVSAISQHLAKEEFRAELAARRTVTLNKYKKLDDAYDELEQSLLDKLKTSQMYLQKPGEIASVLHRINSAKRRLNDPSTVQQTPVQQITQIVMPVQVVHQFTKTQTGHVVGVDTKSLVTMQTGTLDLILEDITKNTAQVVTTVPAMQTIEDVKLLPKTVLPDK